MDHEFQLKLQAFLDGELAASEIRAMENRLATDSEAQTLLNELKNTRNALSTNDPELKLPESREFFWSKIEREIRSLENKQEWANASGRKFSIATFLRKRLIPIGSFAAVLLVAFLAVEQTGLFSNSDSAAIVESATADPGAFSYQDHSSGMTLVWLSYPAENELAEADSSDTL